MTRTVRTAGRLPPTLALVATLSVAGWLGLVGLHGPLSAPPAAAAEPCVGVVVDARLLGGDVSTGCATGDPGSGLEALSTAGFRYAFVPRQPGLVCQVEGVPACDRTSTTTYWSYWYRAKGSRTWVYSSTGAGSRDPAPGSTEAWVWQEGGRREPPDVPLRTICPQAVATPSKSATTRAPATRPPTAGAAPSATGSATASGASDRPAGAGSSARTTGTGPASPGPATATTTTPGTGGSPTASAPAPATDDPATTAAAASGPGDGGGPRWVGLAIGAGLVAALGAAAAARSRRGAP